MCVMIRIGFSLEREYQSVIHTPKVAREEEEERKPALDLDRVLAPQPHLIYQPLYYTQKLSQTCNTTGRRY